MSSSGDGARQNRAAVHVGRLLEVRADAGYRSADDVDAIFDQIDLATTKVAVGTRCIAVVDWRRCPVMAPEAADRMKSQIVKRNLRTDRSAALASADAPVAVMQFVRLIREANLPDRRLFFSDRALVEWLHDALTGAEAARLRQFLGELRVPPSPRDPSAPYSGPPAAVENSSSNRPRAIVKK